MHRLPAKVLLVGSILLSALPVWAAKSAVVSIDGAMVYKDASFDAPVIAYLKKGKRVIVSNRTYGPFFKIKLRPGLIGYISDIDIKFEDSGGGGDGDSSSQDDFPPPEKGGRSGRRPPPQREYDMPIFATRSLGVGGGMINFKEEVLQQKPSANVQVYGVKLTGPNILFQGPYIFDINATFSFKPPSFYDTLTDSGTEASGFLALVDADLLFPIATGYNQNWMVYIGGGPLVVYSKFQITHAGQTLDLQEIKLGGSFVGGMAYRLGRFMVKLDGKYYVEKSSYFGALASVQRQF